jgi:hypothetical protein
MFPVKTGTLGKDGRAASEPSLKMFKDETGGGKLE